MSGVPTGLDLLNSLAALAVAAFVLWLLLLDFEVVVQRSIKTRFLFRRLAEDRGSRQPTIPQQLRLVLIGGLPFYGDRYLRAQLRRYANHPACREEWLT